MYATQYVITLPADYAMEKIRQRVAARGHLTDAFPGLGLKAYLVREAGVDGARVNQYAPFYVWTALEGTGRFLWEGGGFDSVIESFGRPAVLNWMGVACVSGPASAAIPRTATLHAESIPADTSLPGRIEQARDELTRHARLPGVHTTVLAVDPRHWVLLRFTLWETCPAEAAGDRYQVLHLSAPHRHELVHAASGGRGW
jgi:hypothetical protein